MPLRSDFSKRNPSIAAHDHFNFFALDPDTVAVKFAEKQIAEMRKGACRPRCDAVCAVPRATLRVVLCCVSRCCVFRLHGG
jgi:hypothetical protein